MDNRTFTPDSQAAAEDTPIWTFRGMQMHASEFNTAMVHLYRGEVARSNVWRQRLDNTTNWAVVAAGAAISFALSDPSHHHAVIILNTLLVTLFLWIEARRYRYYELWSHRVRLMETDFFSSMLVPPFGPHPEWAESLAETLLLPDFPISMWEAFGRRFRRNYVWVYLVMALAWVLKTFLFPTPALSINDFISRSALGTIPGWAVLVAGFAFNAILFIIGFATVGLQQASGEVLPRVGGMPLLNSLWRSMRTPEMSTASPGEKNGRRLLRRRRQLLSLVVCTSPENVETVAQHVMHDLKRGVTALHGTGMYSGQSRNVLMIAITVTELAQLKATVKAADPKAFVVVAPAQEVLGAGFQSLSA